MSKRMLIDAVHPEETRVVIENNNRIEEFDFADGHSGLLIKYLGMTPRTGNHPKARANRRMSFANAQARRQPIAKANISPALVGQIGRKSNAFLERAVACG